MVGALWNGLRNETNTTPSPPFSKGECVARVPHSKGVPTAALRFRGLSLRRIILAPVMKLSSRIDRLAQLVLGLVEFVRR
jgi:hypothetical protein